MFQAGQYEIYVVADCGGDGMAASEMVAFMTEEGGEENIDSECETPYNMTVAESGDSSVDIYWEPQDDGFYHIAWGPVGLEMNDDFFNDPQTGSIIVSENPFHLIFTGPERFEPRSLYLRKFCGEINFSEWAEPVCIEPSNLESSQEEEDITLTWTPGDYESSWQVAYGPESFDVNDGSNPLIYLLVKIHFKILFSKIIQFQSPVVCLPPTSDYKTDNVIISLEVFLKCFYNE